MRLLMFFLIIPFFSFGQENKDTKVTVIASDTTNLFNRVVMTLYEKGFSLEQKDEQLKFAATAEKSLPKTALSIKVRVLVKGSAITFSGIFASEVKLFVNDEKTFSPIEYRKGNIWTKDHWNVLVDLAKQFGKEIYYSK